MSDEPKQPPREPSEQQSSNKADLIAVGIGCAVFLIMFVAVVLVAMSGR